MKRTITIRVAVPLALTIGAVAIALPLPEGIGPVGEGKAASACLFLDGKGKCVTRTCGVIFEPGVGYECRSYPEAEPRICLSWLDETPDNKSCWGAGWK